MIKLGIGLAVFIIFMAGASVFSFLNVVAYRSIKGESFIKGRSYCPNCSHELSWADLIPIISYIVLWGKCRYCKKHIDIKDTIFELIGGVLLIAVVFGEISRVPDILLVTPLEYAGIVLRIILLFAFFCVLDVVALIDMAVMEIRNNYVIILALLAIAAIFVFPEVKIWERLIGMVAVSVPMLIIALIIPGGFGGGDIKLMIPVGFMLGLKLVLVGFFLAVLGGGAYGAYLLLAKKADRRSHFAFGPFLCAGMTISILCGEKILSWYTGFLFH